jgi:hypothetical protein
MPFKQGKGPHDKQEVDESGKHIRWVSKKESVDRLNNEHNERRKPPKKKK